MNQLNDRVAAITGAASGIGRSLALKLNAEGCRLALADINKAGLEETARKVTQTGGTASVHLVDVSNAEQVKGYAEATMAEHGAVNILINNAGLTYTGNFLDHDLSEWERIMGTNLMGSVYGCRFFLPHLLAAEEAHIVNLSSLFGIVGMPGQSAYCASKFAVRGLSECLWAELVDTQVGLTLVHPGGVATNIVENSGFADPRLREPVREAFKDFTTPDEAAALIVRAIERNQKRLIITNKAKIADLVKRVAPVRSVGWFANSLRDELSLQAFEEDMLLGSKKPD